MKLVKDVDGNAIYQRRDGRFAVKNSKGQPVNGDEKTAILLAEGLIKLSVAQEAPAEEAPAEEAAEETTEEAAE